MSNNYDYYTISQDNYGNINVYGWDTYPEHSVLAGQSRKNFIESFNTDEEAKEAFPDAEFSSHWTEPQNTFDHL
ncbi:hypothetical protein ACKGJO_06715 [Gracilimonas sp. Q87]|uniref:hypothetical protein n=1 Tax=Gracilimonas sp. Q87 TaxID=3384766 RepID=UPI0039844EB9